MLPIAEVKTLIPLQKVQWGEVHSDQYLRAAVATIEFESIHPYRFIVEGMRK
jgi:hypothetical protein